MNKPYSQMLRDSYCREFPDSSKAETYREIDASERLKYADLRKKLQIRQIAS